jgi:hypothetical protein
MLASVSIQIRLLPLSLWLPSLELKAEELVMNTTRALPPPPVEQPVAVQEEHNFLQCCMQITTDAVDLKGVTP